MYSQFTHYRRSGFLAWAGFGLCSVVNRTFRRLIMLVGVMLGLFLIVPTDRASAAEVRLSVTNAVGGVDVEWVSQSLTPTAPFLHYEFEIQHSSNLEEWATSGAAISGGFEVNSQVSHAFHLGATNRQRFVRLNYRLNMPGGNLSGLDLRGADLRGANLAGANLFGANLDGAQLAGADLADADLSGASLAGANLQGLDLTGFDLSGLDLSTILGMPVLSRVTANPNGSAAGLVPEIPYNSDGTDLVSGDANLVGTISTRHAMLMLKTNATIGQLNVLLAAHGAAIVAISPGDETLPNATLMARFPTSSAQELYDLTVALNEDPIIDAAAPDIRLGPTVVPNDQNAAPGWAWDPHGVFAGGNWGLEMARVPEMWNVYSALQNKGVGRVPTCVLDEYFYGHSDLSYAAVFSSGHSLNSTLNPADHGNHVSGIIGATYGNNLGTDGVNPLASLFGFENRGLQGYNLAQDIREISRRFPATKVINVSLGYNWYQDTNSTRPTITNSFSTSKLNFINFIGLKYGTLMSAAALASSSKLIVCAAGNDFNLIPANLASPLCYAALTFGVPNILVVGSHDPSGARSTFSNDGAHVLAPGEGILSAGAANPTNFLALRGTSMASPVVAGVAGYLLAVNPSLSPPTLKGLIGTDGSRVDAFESLMKIDQIQGNKDVLRMLLDIDDSSADGSLRVLVPGASPARDRTFEEITGDDFTNLAGVIGGDEKINMADFRRWRDWWLFGAGNHQLNGSVDHLSLDANGNGTAHPFDDSQIHPRGDFNGDGLLDLTTAAVLPGLLPRTDLQVLTFSGLWDDPCYPDPIVLEGLVDSVDFHVSATNFFYKNTDIGGEVSVKAYDADMGQPLADGGICLFSPDEPEHVLTVPTGKRYYVASDSISIGAGTNVAMRSIGEVNIPDSRRGADFAVDLALWEMTAEAHQFNPPDQTIDSRPLDNLVEAYLAPGVGLITGGSPPSVGARSWATNSGTLYSITEAGGLQTPRTNENFATTWSSSVRWQRSFVKDASVKDPRFLVKPMKLNIAGFEPSGNDLSARAEIVIEMRAYDISPGWQPVFIYHAQIAGHAASGGNPHTFRIVLQEGDLPEKELQVDGTFAARYEQERHRDRINLDRIANGHTFELRYHLFTETYGLGSDQGAGASLGDPLIYGSGVRMEYGDFGDLPRINRIRNAPPAAGIVQAAAAQVTIDYLSKSNFYYRLYQGGDADTDAMPIAMKLGIGGEDSMIDPAPLLASPTEEDYTLENQPVDRPLDFDGDNIDDVYELRHPSILNPLDPNDAFLDPDGDGRSNLVEYQDGTDPGTSDSPPSSPTLNFPGIILPSYPGGDLIDINGDGVLDSAKQNLVVALGHLGGEFADEVDSPLTGMRTVGGAAYLELDGDGHVDAVLTDSLTNKLFLFHGAGNGTFTALTPQDTINGATKIVPCRLNGDGLIDIAVMSRNSRGVGLHVNNGDGTLTHIGDLTTNSWGIATGLGMGDLNSDGQDDVIIGYFSTAVVFLSQPDHSYGPAQPYPVGVSPESIAVGDLNHDGRMDVVIANRSSGTLSVLAGSASGALTSIATNLVGELPLGLRLIDINEDNHLDAVVSRVSADFQTVFLGLGDGTFAASSIVPMAGSLTGVTDWNKDGHLDLVAPIDRAGLIILGNGDGTFDTRLQIVPTNNPPTQVTAVDLNGDGKLVLIGLQAQQNSIDVWEHAAATGTNRLLSSFRVGSSVSAYATGDFNGDGRIDVAVITHTNSFNPRGSNQVVILTNIGSYTFQDAGHYLLDIKPTQIVSGDFNGDGAQDLAVHIGGGTLNGGSRMVSMLGDGAAGFVMGTPVVVSDVFVSSMLPVNADRDSRDEVILFGTRTVAGNSTTFLEVFSVDSTGAWTNQQSLAFGDYPSSMQVAFANGDSYPDLMTLQTDQSTGENSLRIFPGGPSGFGSEQVVENAVEFRQFGRLVDLNGDGLIDILSFNSIYLAKAGGGYHPAQQVWVGAEGARDAVDFNGDGKLDLLNGLSVLLQK